MNIVLIFLIVYVVASTWDAGRVNRSFGKIGNPGPSKQELLRRRRYDAWLSSHIR